MDDFFKKREEERKRQQEMVQLDPQQEAKPLYDDRLFTMMNEFEGNEPEVYLDEKGKRTVGTGLNLDSPVTRDIASRLGYDVDGILSGSQQLTPEMNRKIFDEKIKENRRLLDVKKRRSFPTFQETEDQRMALESLIFQNPKLLGPNLERYLGEGDLDSAGKEVILRSNKRKSPGAQLRRIKEAELLLGRDKLQNLFETMDDQEKSQVIDLLEKIDNKFTKEQFFDEYPFLKQMVPKKNFKKLLE